MLKAVQPVNTGTAGFQVLGGTDLVLGARSVFRCADHQVNVAPLTRLVQVFSDGEHSSSSSTSVF